MRHLDLKNACGLQGAYRGKRIRSSPLDAKNPVVPSRRTNLTLCAKLPQEMLFCNRSHLGAPRQGFFHCDPADNRGLGQGPVRLPVFGSGEMTIKTDETSQSPYFTSAQIVQIINAAGESYKTMFALAAVMGRAGELMALSGFQQQNNACNQIGR